MATIILTCYVTSKGKVLNYEAFEASVSPIIESSKSPYFLLFPWHLFSLQVKIKVLCIDFR